jgi:uncharacterized protein
MDEDLATAIEDEMETRLDGDPIHDLHHVRRVKRLAVKIAETEGADTEIVGAAALVHDLHRVRGGEEYVHPRETLPEVNEIMQAVDFPEDKIPAVEHCVAVHDEYEFESDPDAVETLEAEIVQDADNLDAIGAVGIARVFSWSGEGGRPLWRPERDDPVGAYEKGDHDHDESTIRHIHEKLLRLRETMNTDTGRELADERHAYLEDFVERFKREWQGEV